ncbi:MAG TPA: VTT domain-containing protein [Allosphingosinicella sp.]|jgi:uncharacterized membrane protein YdjX (TVP38/TMEM64 family)|nr:VTT domain-containing protein [Allosphingosinicella sp.]
MSTNTERTSFLRPLLLAGLLLVFILVPWFAFGDWIEARSRQVLSAGSGSIALSGMLLLAADVLLPVPSSIVATTMGALLGAGAGTVVNAVGLTMGCTIGFGVGRLGTPLSAKFLGPDKQAAFERWVTRNGIPALILCRAVPVLAEASAIILGAGRAGARPVLAAAVAADVALGAVYASAGATLGPQAAPAAPAVAAAVLIPAAAAVVLALCVKRTRT